MGMMYGTAVTTDGDGHARVITKPKKTSRTYVYPLRRVGDVWVLCIPRSRYTEHALRWAQGELDDEIVLRHIPPEQTLIDDFHGGGGVQAAKACAD